MNYVKYSTEFYYRQNNYFEKFSEKNKTITIQNIWGGSFTREENGNQVLIGLISSYSSKGIEHYMNFIR